VTDNTGLPPDTCDNQERMPVRLQSHDLGEIGAEGRSNETAGLGQDLVEVTRPEGEFTEFRQGRLLPKQSIAIIFALVAQLTRSLR
jgi:hypothetical protein